MKVPAQKVKELLLKQSYITEDDIKNAEKKGEKDLVDYLLSHGLLTKELLGEAIAEHYKINYVDLETKVQSKYSLKIIPMEVIQQSLVTYLGEHGGVVELITPDPENIPALTETFSKTFVGKKLHFNYALDEDFERFTFKFKKSLQDRFSHFVESEVFSAPKIFNEIVSEANNMRSSDIHIEPQHDTSVLIRYRIDGMLKEVASINRDVYDKVLNRVKVLAHMKLDEHFSPQDGSIRIDDEKGSLDLRVSIAPTLEGEKIVIRILSDYIRDLSLEDLGLNDSGKSLIMEAIRKHHGMILNTGPTGSGKTTTLYAILKTLQSPEINITTIEDPVEYRIPGVNQIQVSPEHNVTFARGLRSIVRQDPNVILVGEIRDKETAEIAVNAALTGHLLLSTFHANDAATAIPRLMDMGVEPFLLSSTINLIIAQRLARRICPHCRASVQYTRESLNKLIPDAKKYFTEANVRLYKGKGCDKCNYTGYKGRVAIFEMIYVTDEMRTLIESSAGSQRIWKLAQSQGAKTYFEDGVSKVLLGNTTLEELLRVAPILSEDEEVYAKVQGKKTSSK